VTGFCESCGKYQSPKTGGALVASPDRRYLCPQCFDKGSTGESSFAQVRVVDGVSNGFLASDTARRGLIVVILGVLTAVAVGQTLSLRAPSEGGVLGIAQSSEPSASALASAPPVASVSPGTDPPPSPRSVQPAATEPPPPESPPTGVVTDPAFQVGEATALTWRGTLDEVRLQVIVPVRNTGPGWIRIPRASSTYEVVDEQGREVASGVFTAALPAMIGPSQTGYLIDTVSVAFVAPSGEPAVTADVEAIATEPPETDLAIADLAASTGESGGLRVTGVVRNVGSRVADWVIAGAVLLGTNGRPLAAVYDPSDVGRLEPGASLPFDTEYPGAPPAGGAGTTLVGVAFEALDDVSHVAP
jgi:hypothetical protein